MVSVGRFQTDGWRNHSQAEVRQANVVVRQTLSTGTELSLVFNHYHLPFAANPSSLTGVAAGDPRLTAAERGGRVPDPRQARPFRGATVAEQNWGESAVQMQGGATLEHRFSGVQVLRATVWASRRRVDTGLGIRALDLRRLGAGLRSEYQGAAEVDSTTLEWTAGVDVSSKDEDRLDYRFLPPFVVGATAHREPLNFEQQEQVASELSLNWRPTAGLEAELAYTRQDFVFRRFVLEGVDYSGKREPGAPPRRLFAGVDYAAPGGNSAARRPRLASAVWAGVIPTRGSGLAGPSWPAKPKDKSAPRSGSVPGRGGRRCGGRVVSPPRAAPLQPVVEPRVAPRAARRPPDKA